MTPQDTMRLALSALEGVLDKYEGLATQFWSCSGGVYEAVACNEAIEALKAALSQQPDADPNAPWMTEAHCLCSDHGIPHGNLTGRIRALRDKLEQQPALSTASKSEQLLASHDHALRAEFQRMKAALAQQGEPVAGWKLVPIEPTKEMLELGQWLEYPESGSRMQPVRLEDVRGVWQAMLAAAPAAQPELPQKARPDFIAGYDAGMADARRMEQQGEQHEPETWTDDGGWTFPVERQIIQSR